MSESIGPCTYGWNRYDFSNAAPTSMTVVLYVVTVEYNKLLYTSILYCHQMITICGREGEVETKLRNRF